MSTSGSIESDDKGVGAKSVFFCTVASASVAILHEPLDDDMFSSFWGLRGDGVRAAALSSLPSGLAPGVLLFDLRAGWCDVSSCRALVFFCLRKRVDWFFTLA